MVLSVSDRGQAQILPVDGNIVFDHPSPGEPTEYLYLDVKINGHQVGQNIFVARRGPILYGRLDDIKQWQISTGNSQLIVIDGQKFVSLPSISGIASQVDEGTQTLAIRADGDAFASNMLDDASRSSKPTTSAPAAFVNYDVAVQHDDGATVSAFVDAGVSTGWGLAANQMILDHRGGRTAGTRLDSYLLHDDPDNLTRLVLGDTVTADSGWARPTRYAGFRIGTEFSLQPDFITFPTPLITGTNVIPSQIDVLVNNVLQYRAQANQGPFSISSVPLVTGAGSLTVRVQDALGVERQITTPYYASRRQLKTGLADWSVEAGSARRNYGYRSFDYGPPFAAAAFRYGLTKSVTLGGRFIAAADAQALGTEGNLTISPWGELGWSAALSNTAGDTGVRYQIGAQHIDQTWNIAASFEHSSTDFHQPGVETTQRQAHDQIQVAGGVSVGALGHVSASYTDIDYVDGDRIRILSANYSITLADVGYLNAFALHSRSGRASTDLFLGLGLTVPLGARSNAYIQADNHNVRGELRLSPPSDRGWGYKLGMSRGDNDGADAELALRVDAGDYRLQVARSHGRNAARLLASGGIVWTQGHLRAGRDLGDAMAVVSIPGLAGAAVYNENRQVGRTDKNGRALITGLRAYTANRISIDPADIPIEDSIGQTELSVVPPLRGVAIARFDRKQIHPATLVLQMPDGSLVPSGTSVRIEAGQTSDSFVGFDGEVFINNLVSEVRVTANTPAGKCSATVSPAGNDAGPLPRVGPVRCAMDRS